VQSNIRLGVAVPPEPYLGSHMTTLYFENNVNQVLTSLARSLSWSGGRSYSC